MRLAPSLIPALVFLAGGSLVAVQHARTAALSRVEADASADPELPRLRAEELRLCQQLPDEAGEARLEQDRDEVVRLRSQVIELWTRLEMKARAEPEPSPSGVRWENKGNGDPRSTLETVVWAACQGDVDTLARLVTFDPRGHARAQALFDQLPPAVRSNYGDVEHVFATLTAARVPLSLSRLDVRREEGNAADAVTLTVDLQRNREKPRPGRFEFRRSGSGWKIVIPDAVLADYERLLGR